CTDFMWYWYHRLGHEVNLFWSVHVVHHQSPDFNYTASVRITVFQAIARTGFWSVLPILGFPAHMITSILLLHGIYPFFTHTRLIGKLGFLEYILVTPSHHRVHHASNPMYLDKNYGDMFIFWDKLFGTFQEETEEPVYGLVHPLYSHSFLWQHFHFLFEMFYTAKRAQGFRNKMRVVFGPPTLIDPNIRSVLERKWHILPGEGSTGKVLRWYTGVQLGAALAVLFVFLLFERRLIWPIEVSISLFLLLTLINCGAILEQKRWVFYLEWMRVLVLIPGLVLFLPLPWVLCLLLALGGVLLLFQERLKERYLAYIFEK
ncbi:MAG: sterol desaturase family protein, partial [Bacteroidetes bacterium]|nr:sterol desaturase family protein [Bacteroidota bacterium]